MITVWSVKTIRSYYPGTYGVDPDSYIQTQDDHVLAVATKAEAVLLDEALDPYRPNYVLSHGEYAPNRHEARRIKYDHERVEMLTEAEACRTLGLNYDLEAVTT